MASFCHPIFCYDEGIMMQGAFENFESRFSCDIPVEVRQDVWNGYRRLLDSAGISESSDLWRYFVDDVFFSTVFRKTAISIGFDKAGETFIRLELRNEYANQRCMDWYRKQFVETNGDRPLDSIQSDEWWLHFDEFLSEAGWDADDFYTNVTFRGVDEVEFNRQRYDGCCHYFDYHYNTILPSDGRLNIALYFSAGIGEDVRLSFRFDDLQVEDILPRLRAKYAGWIPELYRGMKTD